MFTTPDLTVHRTGKAGVLTLNRPQALNALNHDMVRAMRDQLEAWAIDPAIEVVLVRGSGDRAFCAGGDIRQIHDLGKVEGKAGTPEQLAFFAYEYRLNAYLHRYAKPLVALIDGIVMGGGVGVSVHGPWRVGSEKTLFAMPEVGIGFFPDVGGTHFLPRLRHEVGSYYALTGERARQADAYAAGILTHCVPSARLDELEAALGAGGKVARTLGRFHQDPGEAPIAPHLKAIERLFSGLSVEEILSDLDREDGPSRDFARKAASVMRAKSPTSQMIALHQMRIGRDMDMDACMVTEFRIVSRIMRGHDFYEGVRAAIIDKGATPQWRPAALSDVDPADIAAHFAPPATGDLVIA